MLKEVKDFIEEHKELIEQNRWEEFYEELENEAKDRNGLGLMRKWFQIVTKTLIGAGINPLDHLTVVPKYYLSGTNIREITIPDNIRKIGEASFITCRELERVELPEGLEIIDHSAFALCDSMESITLPSTLKYISGFAFAYNALIKEIVIPESVKYVDGQAFSYISKLERVEISSKTTVHKKAFFNSDNFVLVVDGKETTKKEYGLE